MKRAPEMTAADWRKLEMVVLRARNRFGPSGPNWMCLDILFREVNDVATQLEKLEESSVP